MVLRSQRLESWRGSHALSACDWPGSSLSQSIRQNQRSQDAGTTVLLRCGPLAVQRELSGVYRADALQSQRRCTGIHQWSI